jgi:hypothetical protein
MVFLYKEVLGVELAVFGQEEKKKNPKLTCSKLPENILSWACFSAFS